MSQLQISLEITEEMAFYLESAARMRGVSRSVLARRTLEIVLKDQMFLSILDDGDRPSDKTASRRGNKGGRPKGAKNDRRVGRDMPPRDHTFDALKPVGAVIQKRKPNAQTVVFKRTKPLTRAEMEADLRQAVLNTGGELT